MFKYIKEKLKVLIEHLCYEDEGQSNSYDFLMAKGPNDL